MKYLKPPSDPIGQLVSVWHTVWKNAADKVSKKTLETMLIFITLGIVSGSLFVMQGFFFIALLHYLA